MVVSAGAQERVNEKTTEVEGLLPKNGATWPNSPRRSPRPEPLGLLDTSLNLKHVLDRISISHVVLLPPGSLGSRRFMKIVALFNRTLVATNGSRMVLRDGREKVVSCLVHLAVGSMKLDGVARLSLGFCWMWVSNLVADFPW